MIKEKVTVGDVFALKLRQGRGRPFRVEVMHNRRGNNKEVMDKRGNRYNVKVSELRAHTATKNMQRRAA